VRRAKHCQNPKSVVYSRIERSFLLTIVQFPPLAPLIEMIANPLIERWKACRLL
jgi:hypothetical protein